jgi:diacylglycerol O-acyltransferase / wax synthase
MARHPRQTLARSSALAEFLLKDELVRAAPSSLNVPTGPSRRYAAVPCALADLATIRAALGGSVNDAVLAVCCTGLRRLLLAREERLPHGGLRAMVPTNLRNTPKGLPIGSELIALPVAEPSARERHRQIVRATQRQQTTRFAEAAGALIDLTAIAPPLVHSSLAQALYGTRLFNLTIATVRGARKPRYALGARLSDVHPIVPLAAEHAVAIAVFFHEGQVTFGISAECEATPDLDVLARGVKAGIQELLDVATCPEGPPVAVNPRSQSLISP